MDNFFDIATPEEVAHHFPLAAKDAERRAHLRESLAKESDRNFGYLASLYFCRGDQEKTEFYLNQIADERERLDMAITLYELREA